MSHHHQPEFRVPESLRLESLTYELNVYIQQLELKSHRPRFKPTVPLKQQSLLLCLDEYPQHPHNKGLHLRSFDPTVYVK